MNDDAVTAMQEEQEARWADNYRAMDDATLAAQVQAIEDQVQGLAYAGPRWSDDAWRMHQMLVLVLEQRVPGWDGAALVVTLDAMNRRTQAFGRVDVEAARAELRDVRERLQRSGRKVKAR